MCWVQVAKIPLCEVFRPRGNGGDPLCLSGKCRIPAWKEFYYAFPHRPCNMQKGFARLGRTDGILVL